MSTQKKANSYTKNPNLKDLDLPFEWKGTPIDASGRFMNHEFPYVPSFGAVLKWQTTKNPQKVEKKSETWRLETLYSDSFIHSKEDCIVWLGHASYFIRIAGYSLLIDPVLFDVSLIKRNSTIPLPADKITGLDYILVSHDHRDHCDEKSLSILAKNNPKATYLTGLNLEAVLVQITKSKKIQSAGWYQQYNTPDTIRITYTPTRHWGRRYLADTNLRLWGGFVIQGADKTIYFGGDSGYGNHYNQLQAIFPSIDYSMLGIGAYKPEFFMAPSHMSPTDAVKAFRETCAKTMIPMHYGTFDLADEPLGDPLRVLHHQIESQSLVKCLKALKPGEILHL